jgi:flavodoxin
LIEDFAMNTIVIYSTRGGNTEKVALEVAAELNCKAVKISKGFVASTLSLDEFDLIFVGTGVYGGEPSADLLKYLKEVGLKDGNRQFALFMTWAGGGKSDVLAFNRIKEYLEAKNQKLLGNCYKCYGSTFSLARRGHPDVQDFTQARKWAKDLCKMA